MPPKKVQIAKYLKLRSLFKAADKTGDKASAIGSKNNIKNILDNSGCPIHEAIGARQATKVDVHKDRKSESHKPWPASSLYRPLWMRTSLTPYAFIKATIPAMAIAIPAKPMSFGLKIQAKMS